MIAKLIIAAFIIDNYLDINKLHNDVSILN